MHVIACLLLLLVVPPKPADLLDNGFNDMYNLAFASAHKDFERWEQLNPGNPLGPVFDAAAYLFAEFDRLKILQAQFFVDDRSYLKRKEETPSPEVKRRFEQALAAGETLSENRLRKSPNDESALLANVLRLGLHADYLALIEKQNLKALKEIKEATDDAGVLLQLDPTCYDADIAAGIENYLLSLKPAPVRWLLQATGAQTDKDTGVAKLRLTASKGHYLQPYAELLLAVVALRDRNTAEARRLLSDLAERFPLNPLYRDELSQIR